MLRVRRLRWRLAAAAFVAAVPFPNVADAVSRAPEPLFAEAVYLEGAADTAVGPDHDTRRGEWARSYRCCGGGTSHAEAWLQRHGPTPAAAPIVQRLAAGTVRLTDTYRPRTLVTAELVAGDGALLPVGGAPLVTYDAVRVEARADCGSGAHGVRVSFTNLVVAGTRLPAAPDPNTTIPLGAWTLVVNEQRVSSTGAGVRVAALHLTTSDTVSRGARSDVVVAQVAVSAACVRSPRATAPWTISHARERAPAGHLRWYLTIANPTNRPCDVARLVLHGPAGAELVATSGDLGSHVSPPSPHGAGTDRELKRETVLAPGATVRQLVTYRVTKPRLYQHASAAADHAVTVYCAGSGFAFGGYGAPSRV